ncbi:MAG: ABC transporter permease subunit, partial [Arenicellales bacterium]|nr:ABC transporter permease subunit [Arenicellales bacterium]
MVAFMVFGESLQFFSLLYSVPQFIENLRFLGGKLDLAVQRFVDAWMAFPGLLLLLTIMSVVGQGILQIIVVLGIAGGIGGSRVVRGAVIGIKENDYFLAARAVGTPTPQILIRHVLPNIMAPIIIIFS